jgi:hypothetical protein
MSSALLRPPPPPPPCAQAPRDRSSLPVGSSKERAQKRRSLDAKSDLNSDSSEDSGDESKRVESDGDSWRDRGSESRGVIVDDGSHDGAQELSEYEKLRLRNIERNNKVRSQHFYLFFSSYFSF